MSDFLGCSRVLLVLFLTTFTFATAARTLSSASLASSSALRDTEPPSKLPREKRLTLYAAGFFPVSTKIQEGAIGRGVIPAVELALQHINDSPKILRGIHLDLVWNDTEVSLMFSFSLFVRRWMFTCTMRVSCRLVISQQWRWQTKQRQARVTKELTN